MRIDGDQRLRPKAPAHIDRIDLISDIRVADLGERAGKARVVRNERTIQIEDIHDSCCSPVHIFTITMRQTAAAPAPAGRWGPRWSQYIQDIYGQRRLSETKLVF